MRVKSKVYVNDITSDDSSTKTFTHESLQHLVSTKVIFFNTQPK